MERSEKIIELTKGLFKFHALVGKIAKDASNPFFKSNYASLSHILEEISDPLQQAGLVITQWPNGTKLTTMLIHAESGEFFQSDYEMPVAKQNDPQALGSAISYARRYAVTSILSLNIDDDDANKASGKTPETTKKKTTSEPDKPWLNKGEQLDKAMEYLRTGGSIETIKQKYAISKEVMASLQTVLKNL